MTPIAWIEYLVCALLAILGAGVIFFSCDSKTARVAIVLVTLVVLVLIFGGIYWYYNNTASGLRAKTNEIAELQLGLPRVITIYTADGTILKQYEGKIDIEQDQGYVKFDWNGKRYIYYNCYVETIAEIPH